MYPDNLLLRAQWGGRADTPDAQTGMVWELMSRLARHGGILAEPWNSLDVLPLRALSPVRDLAELTAAMTLARRDHRTDSLSFMQAMNGQAYLTMSVSIGNPTGSGRKAANTVLVDIEAPWNIPRPEPVPVAWLLGLAETLVTDIVDVFCPDAASLDSSELTRVRSRGFHAWPAIGYASWLSDAVVDPGRLPRTPVRRRHGSGTLIGIAADSPDPLGEATQLAMDIYDADILRIVPLVQNRADPRSG